MDRASRNELLKTIESQREKIERYEKKLPNLVQAYKSLQKEKEAIENSFKVLSTSASGRDDRQTDSEKTRDSEDGTSNETQNSNNGEFTDPLQAHKEQTKSDDSDKEEQMKTLSQSLYTLTEEKSKLEASYIADKKSLIQEKEELQTKLDEEIQKNEEHIKTLDKQIQELKNRVRGQQKEREKEQNDHALMLRELQKLLGEERTKVEILENKLEDTSEVLKEKEKLVPSMSGVYEKRIKDLNSKLEASKNETRALREKSRLPTPELIAAQREIADLKEQSHIKHQQEQTQASEAEDRMEGLRQQCEGRVAELESKLSQLSEMVGTYEHQKTQDQQMIQKLKDRVSQLDLENTALAQASHSEDSLENMDVQSIADKIVKLKEHLIEGNKKTSHPVLIQDLLYDEDNQCTMCKKLKEELEVAKEEFERYKLRAQSVLKNKATKDSGPNKEMESLKSQVADLREKIKTFHVQHEEAIQRANQRADSASKTVISLQEKHKQDLLHHQAEHQHQVSQLEIEIKKQRERTVSLLSEKDREIEVLRASTPVFDGGYLAHIRNPPDAAASEEMQAKSEEEQAVHRLLKMGQGEANLLYFSQEQARKEVEINVLRKQKHELESALRDLQLTSFSKEEALQEQVENMREEVRKVERNIAREGANLEYLKNVTFKFLTSVDPRAKQQMLNAITTILQFSPQEKSVVHTQLKSWWTSTV